MSEPSPGLPDVCSIVGCHRTGSGVRAGSPRLSDSGATARIVRAQRVRTAIDERRLWTRLPGFKLDLALTTTPSRQTVRTLLCGGPVEVGRPGLDPGTLGLKVPCSSG